MQRAKSAKIQSRSLVAQQNVIAAVARLIAEQGISAATTANIAAYAGVSWGVLQYQFGGKQAIFLAVLVDSTERLEAELGALDTAELAPAEALEQTLDTLWSHYSQPHYRAALEILLNHGHLTGDFLEAARSARGVLARALRKLLKDCGFSAGRSETDALVELIVAALRGLALGKALAPGQATFARERKMLAKLLLGHLRLD